MNAMYQIGITVQRPAQPAKKVRLCPPTLEMMRTDAAILAAIAQRDKLWSEAVRIAGGEVL
ncbi:hypothetical protein [Pseudomonas petrae]|uniref:hypothetical protein n=1 Tax=Pseudomonas petrae TaxID=2912190 RepID=UPI001F463300|nr:hypothetical protein [Pseudomonas petrae]MCF7536198.1 hypothetical protein [Pseudomonas petrae]